MGGGIIIVPGGLGLGSTGGTGEGSIGNSGCGSVGSMGSYGSAGHSSSKLSISTSSKSMSDIFAYREKLRHNINQHNFECISTSLVGVCSKSSAELMVRRLKLVV